MSLDGHYIHETRTGDPLIKMLAGTEPDPLEEQYRDFFRQRFSADRNRFITFEPGMSPEGFIAHGIQWAYGHGLLREEFLDEDGRPGDVRSFCLTAAGTKAFAGN